MRLRRLAALDGCRALCAGPANALLARRRSVFQYHYASGRLEPICEVPRDSWRDTLLGASRWGRRVARAGVRAGLQLDEDRYLLCTRGALYEVAARKRQVRRIQSFARGWLPLSLSWVRGVRGFDDTICWGEYGSNPDKEPVSIWGDPGGGWRRMHTFVAGQINHIHALCPDPDRACVWVLTGDYGGGAGIWRARDGFRRVEPILVGSQAYRSCRIFPTERGLLYATDSHLEPNHVCEMREEDGAWSSRPLHRITGSCLHAARFAQTFAFTTAVEPGAPSGSWLRDLLDVRPGPGIDAARCDLVLGDPVRGFNVELSWDADGLPPRLFGFHTILLPTTWGEVDVLLLTGAGVKANDETTVVFTIVE